MCVVRLEVGVCVLMFIGVMSAFCCVSCLVFVFYVFCALVVCVVLRWSVFLCVGVLLFCFLFIDPCVCVLSVSLCPVFSSELCCLLF